MATSCRPRPMTFSEVALLAMSLERSRLLEKTPMIKRGQRYQKRTNTDKKMQFPRLIQTSDPNPDLGLDPDKSTCRYDRRIINQQLMRSRSESLMMSSRNEQTIKEELFHNLRVRKRKRNSRRGRRNADSDVMSSLVGIGDQAHPDLDADDVEKVSQMIRSGASEAKINGWKRLRLATKKQQRLRQARNRFKRAVRMVVILQRALSYIIKRPKTENREVMTFTEIANDIESDAYKHSGLSFDPRDYRAKKEINISNEVKHVLSLPSSARKPEQLQTALYGLQTIRSFAEYPLHMQEKLVKVAWFETIPPKRVIIRQGHNAENFYFIISGAVVVTIMDSKSGGDGHARTAAVLRKGSSFGEIALLHRSKRTATVSSQGHVQLLCIGRDDFFDIFMRGQHPGEEPEHIQYLRKLPFMKHWPVEKLIESPEMCLFHFYKRGQVIVKDSNLSDWIYVVMSGTCQVLKQLKAVTPQFTSFDVKLPRLSVDQKKTRHPKCRTGRKKSNTTVADYQYLAVPTLHGNVQKSEFQRLMAQDDPSLPHSNFMSRRKSIMSNASEEKAPSTGPWSLTISIPEEVQRASDSNLAVLPEIQPDLRKGATPTSSYSKSGYQQIATLNKSAASSSQSHLSRSTPLINNDNSSDDSSEINHINQNEISVFVQIELLQRRDVFGLSTLNMDLGIDHEQASVSLVSNGAECIMIKKDFFVKHCTDTIRRHIRGIMRPYPSPSALQHNLQSHADWSHYKEEKVSDIMQDITRLRELKF